MDRKAPINTLIRLCQYERFHFAKPDNLPVSVVGVLASSITSESVLWAPAGALGSPDSEVNLSLVTVGGCIQGPDISAVYNTPLKARV